MIKMHQDFNLNMDFLRNIVMYQTMTDLSTFTGYYILPLSSVTNCTFGFHDSFI